MFVTRLIATPDRVLYETLFAGDEPEARQLMESVRQSLKDIELSTPNTIALKLGEKSITYCLTSEE